MKDNTQTRNSAIDYYFPPGHYVSSTPTVRSQTILTTRNGEGGTNHTAPTSYGFRKRLITNDVGYMTRKDGEFDQQSWIGPYPPSLPDQLGWTPWTTFDPLYERALGNLMDEIRGGNQVVVDLAESASTMRMVSAQNNAGSRIAEILDIIHGEVKRKRKHFERLDKRDRTQKILDFATGRWLEYRYGWLPLVSSVYDALDILHKENLERVRTVVGRSRDLHNREIPFEEINFFGGKIQGLHKIHAIERCRIVVEMYTPGSGIWDWTSLSPSVIAWELLPMSFVADWFVSVGDSLAYLENWLLWKNQFKSGYITYTGIGTESWKLQGSSTNGYYTLTSSKSGKIESSFKNRIVLTELPLPFAPRVKVNLNAHRSLDAVSLIASGWRKRIRKIGLTF